MRGLASLVVGTVILFLLKGPASGKEIFVFCGAALRPPLEEAARDFEANKGVRVSFTFGGSGAVLSQMEFSRRGDLYIPGSSEYLEVAKERGLVLPGTERRIAFLIPVILVQRGNPKRIEGLEDLARPGIRVAIGNPETVAVGSLAREILEFNGLWERVKGNIVTYAETGPKLVSLLMLGAVDAVIGFRVFAQGEGRVEVVALKQGQVPRLARVSGAVSAFSQDPRTALDFLQFLAGEKGREIFRRWGYLVDEGEANRFVSLLGDGEHEGR